MTASRTPRRRLPRPGGLQLQPVHDQRRSGLHGPLRDGRPDPGHLQHLPQHAERRRPLRHPHGGHRHGGRAELQPGPADLAVTESDPPRPAGSATWAAAPPACGRTSRSSASRRCAVSRRARRTSTTARRRTSAPPSVITRIGSTSTCPTASGRIWKRSWGPSRPRSIPRDAPAPDPGSGGVFFTTSHTMMTNARGDKEAPAATAPAAAWVPGTRFSNYEIESLLATGGMAEVWRANMKGVAGFEKRVVIKTMLTRCNTGGSWSTCSSARRRWPPAQPPQHRRRLRLRPAGGALLHRDVVRARADLAVVHRRMLARGERLPWRRRCTW